MAPLDKALELRNKYFDALTGDNLHMRYAIADKLAIIAVDEILNSWQEDGSRRDTGIIYFWQKVKTELQNI